MNVALPERSGPAVALRSRSVPSLWMQTRLERACARTRLESVMRAITADLIGPVGSDSTGPAADWVRSATEAAIDAACVDSLQLLASALEGLLDVAPPEVSRRLETARRRAEAGLF